MGNHLFAGLGNDRPRTAAPAPKPTASLGVATTAWRGFVLMFLVLIFGMQVAALAYRVGRDRIEDERKMDAAVMKLLRALQ